MRHYFEQLAEQGYVTVSISCMGGCKIFLRPRCTFFTQEKQKRLILKEQTPCQNILSNLILVKRLFCKMKCLVKLQTHITKHKS